VAAPTTSGRGIQRLATGGSLAAHRQQAGPRLVLRGDGQHSNEDRQPSKRQPAQDPRLVMAQDQLGRFHRDRAEVHGGNKGGTAADTRTQKLGPTQPARHSSKPVAMTG
jgi:hypothetical protein